MTVTINKKQFALNAVSGWAAQFTFALVGFILMPYIIFQLGEKGYGIYQLARSALVFFMFLELGMGPTLVRFFSKAIARNDKQELGRISSTAQFLIGCLGLLASLLGLTLVPFFVHFYDIPTDFVFDTTGLLISMAISVFLNILTIVPQGLVYGINRYDLANYVEVSSHLMRLALVVALFELVHASILFVGLAMLLAQLFRFFALFVVVIKHFRIADCFSIHKVAKKSMRSLLGFSVLNLTNSIAAAVTFQGPILIIGKVLGQEMVTAFAPALLISSAMQGFLGQITKPLVPVASHHQEHNNVASLANWAISTGQLSAFVGFGIALPLASFGPELMRLWLGRGLVWVWPAVAVMTAGVAISQVQSANYFLALGGGNIKPTVYSQVAMAVVVFMGILAGTIWLTWDIFAVALYIAACIFLRNTFYLAFAYSRQFAYSYQRYLWSVYGVSFLIAALCTGLGWLLKLGIPPVSLILLTTEAALVLAIYSSLSWLFLLPKSAKDKIIKLGLAKMRYSKAMLSRPSRLM